MSFEDCACHVWAIDGYTDDAEAKKVNDAYNDCAASLRTTDSSKSRQQAITALFNAARLTTALTDVPATLYGGFRWRQKAPEHMWIECNGYIYDTMPGSGLCQVAATSNYRTCPGLENKDFGTGAVCIDIKLTVSQYRKIVQAEFIPPTH